MNALLCVMLVSGVGFTKAEIDALPKADPPAVVAPPKPVRRACPPRGPLPQCNMFVLPAGPGRTTAFVPLPAANPAATRTARAAYKAALRRSRMDTYVETPDYGMLQVQAMAARVWRGGLP
jgi:hypothetical protein